jgi:hypothetical protein
VAETITFLYDRVGQYLLPRIQDGHIENGGGKMIAPESGICRRTGVTGPVIQYVESIDGDAVVIPTHIHLRWLFAEQHMFDSKGVAKRFRIGKGRMMALFDDKILTNIPFQIPLPNSHVLRSNEILREIAGQQCLFLGFGDKPSAVFDNGLRWSTSSELEINGKLSLAGDVTLSNTRLNIMRSVTLTECMSKRTAIDVRRLLLLKDRVGLTDDMHGKLEELAADLPLAAVRSLYTASEPEMIMAYRLWGTGA